MIRLVALLRRLQADRRGASAVEFAIWASLFFVTMLGAADFGIWRSYQLRLGSAIEQGSMMAFNNRATLNSTYTDSIRTYIANAATLPVPPTVTASCNGATCVSTARQCACLSNATPAAYVNATCGTVCTTRPNTTAGYYLTLTASHPFTPVVLPEGALKNRTISESITVRLQ